MTLREFVQSRAYLFWSVKDLSLLSDEAIVEQLLNYGDFDDVQTLCSLMGVQKVARIFTQQSQRRRTNYSPALKQFFRLYFQQYAS
ncbi:hypothetical protein HYZ64_03115 [Candidatus Berkelbacteria bacterium]|nr:hypothetical protein [Candidatus Berkelbacteria bacterium]